MKTIRWKSRGNDVYLLEDILTNLGYEVKVTTYFGKDTHEAILDFQRKNNLVVDGIVGPKTWSLLLSKNNAVNSLSQKLLSEGDLIQFAEKNSLELAVVKAVNEVESRGKGFLVHGRPVILFEGHVFWRELEKRGLKPRDFLEKRLRNVLYPKWTSQFYEGGKNEYNRLEKAAGMSDLQEVHDAAYCAASWGSFQIMGFHYKSLGYQSVDQFVSQMYVHEREHLVAFGKFISVNTYKGKSLVEWLRLKNWTNFARAYNGPGYKKNKYDSKLEKAYKYHQSLN